MLMLDTGTNRSNHRTLRACAARARSLFAAGVIKDEDEKIATVNVHGVVRDLDGKVVVLT